jgi:osmotically-inducible protein OsmY
MKLVGRLTAAMFLMAFFAAPGNAASADDDLQRQVERRLAKEEVVGFTVEVDARGNEVTLRGEVPSLWHKEWAIDRARMTDGVVGVVSYLTIRDADGPHALARGVAEAIRRYPYYTVFDYVSGSIKDSIVTLHGVVTARPDKPSDLYERVSRVPGVKGIVTELDVLSPGIGDERIRAALARGLYGHPAFHRYVGLDPGIHLIVKNGYVTLKGAVLTQADRIQADAIARRTFGVIRVDNQLRTKEEMRKAAPQPDAAGVE